MDRRDPSLFSNKPNVLSRIIDQSMLMNPVVLIYVDWPTLLKAQWIVRWTLTENQRQNYPTAVLITRYHITQTLGSFQCGKNKYLAWHLAIQRVLSLRDNGNIRVKWKVYNNRFRYRKVFRICYGTFFQACFYAWIWNRPPTLM